MSTLEPARQLPAPVASDPGRIQSRFARTWWIYAILLLGLLAMIGPFLWMLLGSLKTQRELLQVPPTWLPENPTTGNYTRLFDQLDFPRYFWNSTLIAVMITLSNVVFCSMMGYALAKLRFFGRDKLFLLVLGTMLVPGSVTLVPLFVLMAKLNLVDNLFAVILPAAAGPVGVFLMRQFMLSIPDELLEAARVDGANEFRIFWQVVLPLCRPALGVIGIFGFTMIWDQYMLPLLVATDPAQYTLPLALRSLRSDDQVGIGVLLVGAFLAMLPSVLAFLALQRSFIRGLTSGAVKG